ncbi:lycopene cyclase family protein [Vreelandella gomseomensis]|uniref:Lycopene cyclase family protein n=1 Tax=Vreelandella gomseomensis TaxID=370766 RepID=A0ABU1GE46_9GAMM|nr:lycopene cyclase family protein [Halomonas gomseomensis]MDR5875754.1 lycopene cyclase family protein [Halomonas gomseomensis]
MSLPASTDVAILGAGLAGLSIATWLDDLLPAQDKAPRVDLLESRLTDAPDRTWCFWDHRPHPFREMISHRWPRWCFHSTDQRVDREDHEAGYAMLSSGDVRQKAYGVIAGRDEFHLRRGVDVSQVVAQPSGMRVDTSRGSIEAQVVIDTRPPPPEALSAQQGVWQVFHGVDIRLADHGYDLSTARLMDFQSGSTGVEFVYLLPLDADRLLVEWTCFHADYRDPACQALMSPDQVPPPLRQWLNTHLGDRWQVERHETGCLPMMPVQPPRSGSRYLSAGIRGGWMRPATGYMFVSCQRGAANVASQLLKAHRSGQWQLTAPDLRSPLLEWMDGVFLNAMRRHPDRAAHWFMALFAATNAAQQRRFLSDEPSLADLLEIMRALPARPFLAAAMRRLARVT